MTKVDCSMESPLSIEEIRREANKNIEKAVSLHKSIRDGSWKPTKKVTIVSPK